MQYSNLESGKNFRALSGIYYARLEESGNTWLMGSVKPGWQEDLIVLGSAPDQEAIDRAASSGTWLAPEAPPAKLGVMCCGMGSAWPHMGRGLYDNFPACREAMDKLAALADWDLLGLLDEPDLEVINDTRKQIPYLFLLEYAQWSQLLALGLKPALLCGHSLGELAALCFSGVYSAESAWYLLDTRAEHMAELEEKAGGRGGMLAVAAGRPVIDEVLATWPTLSIANYNASHQFILGGPRKEIMEARRALRRKKIPAMALNIGLAFHNPAMAILRGLSLRRLNALEMRPPAIPMLSCVKLDLYPAGQREICEYIADLDENMVNWPGMLEVMIKKHRIEAFLELGPRETLCGLVMENGYKTISVPVSGKDREVEAMREACARLFSMNMLPQALHAAPAVFFAASKRKDNLLQPKAAPVLKAASPDLKTVLDLLASISGVPRSDLRFDMDLRHDLGVQSSRFPLLIQEAEEKLGRSFDLEKLLEVATIGDLIRVLLRDEAPAAIQNEKGLKKGTGSRLPYFHRPFYIRRFEWIECAENLKALKIDPVKIAYQLQPDDLLALYIEDADLIPRLFQNVAPLKLRLAIPKHLIESASILEKSGATLVPFEFATHSGQCGEVLDALDGTHGPIRGVIVSLQPEIAFPQASQKLERLLGLPSVRKASWRLVIQRFLEEEDSQEKNQPGKFFSELAQVMKLYDARFISWPMSAKKVVENLKAGAAILPWEIRYGRERAIVWKLQMAGDWTENLCPSSDYFNFAKPARSDGRGDIACECQFSSFDNGLLDHGQNGVFSPVTSNGEPERGAWLPLSSCFQAAMQTARIEAPWLYPLGFSDSRIFHFSRIAQGLTRESRVVGHLKPWLLQEGRMTRMCRVEVAMQTLHPNGRAKEEFKPVLNTVCLLGAENMSLRPVWEQLEPLQAELLPSCGLDEFYKMLGLGNEWRFVKSIRIARFKPGLECCSEAEALLSPPVCPIADGVNWRYMLFLQLTDEIFQATLATIALASGFTDAENMARSLGAWRFGAIGYLRFDGNVELAESELFARIRCTWFDESIQRFDIQVSNSKNQPVATAHHWEFESVVDTVSDK